MLVAANSSINGPENDSCICLLDYLSHQLKGILTV